ncbi:porin [Nitrosomonas aestuarii]|uniref:porin n=1 Tax=Nitrosomonas aestuarii TaxID=52441 RepID=UPI000D3146A9|nr:porin [Nitrosomonas aestuarii]PTN11045.1 putative porin [Nitrosomonas aestuarii]
MSKTLISAALTGIFALTTAGSAFATTTKMSLVGRIQSEYSHINIEGYSSQSLINDPTFFSSWGFRIFENLGNGFQAMAMIDFGFDTNGSAQGSREIFVGINNDAIGTLKIGRTHSPFADFAGGWTIDPLVYTTLQAAGSGGTMIASANGLGAGAYSAVNSVVRFTSAEFNGFSFAALLMPGDSEKLEANLGGVLGGHGGNIGETGGEDGEWDVQFAAKYVWDFHEHKFEVFGGYSRDNVSTAQKRITAVNLKTEEVGRIGGVWSYKNVQIQGQYDFISDAIGAATCSDAAALGAIGQVATRQCNSAMNAGGDGNIWYVGGQYKMGNATLVAQGGMTDAHGTSVFKRRAAKSYTIGGLYHLSKRTNLFGGYQRVNVINHNETVDRDRNTWTVGLRHLF